jgi:hypothetical protein
VLVSEYDEQKLVFEWANIYSYLRPQLELLNGSLNGVRLTVGQAVKAKRAGMKKGFPDINLPIPRRGFHGLFIELKKGGGVPSDVSREQKNYLTMMASEGNHCAVCFGAGDAIDVITWYLDGK